jgi:hypothetical protein
VQLDVRVYEHDDGLKKSLGLLLSLVIASQLQLSADALNANAPPSHFTFAKNAS